MTGIKKKNIPINIDLNMTNVNHKSYLWWTVINLILYAVSIFGEAWSKIRSHKSVIIP